MKRLFATLSFFLVLTVVCAVNVASANEQIFADDFESYALGDLNEQGNWEVTNYYDMRYKRLCASPTGVYSREYICFWLITLNFESSKSLDNPFGV